MTDTPQAPAPGAVDLGINKYQGNPCKRGHIGVRYKSTRNCVDCDNERNHRRNKDQRSASVRRYYLNNQEKIKAYHRERFLKNPGYAVNACRVRRGRLRKAEGTHTDDDVIAIAISQSLQCNYCHEELKEGAHVDHKTPISRGGSNWPSNLQVLCPRCNRRKGNKTHEEFLLWRNVHGG